MQVPYYTKVSLQQYYILFGAAKWDIPDFSDKCLICGGEDCAKYHGCYTRTVKCPLSGFYVDDFPIIRIFCYRKGAQIKCDHVTFSLLPLDLVPFRQLSLQFMVLAVWLRLIQGLSLTKSADAIENMVVNLGDIATFVTNAAQLEWKNLSNCSPPYNNYSQYSGTTNTSAMYTVLINLDFFLDNIEN